MAFSAVPLFTAVSDSSSTHRSREHTEKKKKKNTREKYDRYDVVSPMFVVSDLAFKNTRSPGF
jgi:hypothetical protein